MFSLSYSQVLAALPPGEQEALADHSVERVLHPEEILHLEGERGDRVHLVISGVLKHSLSEAGETIVGLSVEGDLLGDTALVNDDPHPFDTIAATPTVLRGFEKDELRSAIQRHPRACLALADTFATRMRWMAAATNDRSTSLVTERLAARLLDLAEIMGRINGGIIDLDLPLAQADLGRLAGMSRESTCKTMRRFRSAGVLDYEGRRVRILRPEVLRHIRCEGRAARLCR